MKVCDCCNINLPEDDFYTRTNGKLCNSCISCTLQKRRNWYLKNKKDLSDKRKRERAENLIEIRKKEREYYYNHRKARLPSQRVSNKFSCYKANAKKRNMNFNLTFEEFKLFWQKPCFYCKSEIKTIGIDRINNSVGYEINNLVPCCSICNVMKNDMTTEEFCFHILKLLEWAKN